MQTTAVDPIITFPALGNAPLDTALFQIGRLVHQTGYKFITVTPDTHALMMKRNANRSATDLRDVFGWNFPFHGNLLGGSLRTALQTADLIEHLSDGRFRARLRCSTVGDQVFLHSGYPTIDRDVVYFGPDTYRFIHLLQRTLAGGNRLLEMGAGTGAAALCLAARYKHLVLTDINAQAVRYARINAALAGVDHIEAICTDIIPPLSEPCDAIIANPPFIIDSAHRFYRDGGELGITVAQRMVEAALPLLTADGCLVLYTGAPIVDGQDLLFEALSPLLRTVERPFFYETIDVDVYGSELANEVYQKARVERLAIVALIVGRAGAAHPSAPSYQHFSAPHRTQS
jgi:SAM-dependent methyltransferase